MSIQLIKALVKAHKIMKPKRPALQYALVQYDGVIITDLMTSIKFPCVPGFNVGALVHVPTLAEAVKLGDDIRADGAAVYVGPHTLKHEPMNTEDFPEIPQPVPCETDGRRVLLDATPEEIKAMASWLPQEPSRFAIDYMAIGPNGSLYATDGRRLVVRDEACREEAYEGARLPGFWGHISQEAAAFIGSVKSAPRSAWWPGVAPKAVEGQEYDQYGRKAEELGSTVLDLQGGIRIYIRQPSRPYPQAASILNGKYRPWATVKKAQLLEALVPICKVKTAGKKETRSVLLNGAISWGDLKYPLDAIGGPLSVRWDQHYLLDLMTYAGEEIKFQKDNTAMVKVERGRYKACLTPINIVT